MDKKDFLKGIQNLKEMAVKCAHYPHASKLREIERELLEELKDYEILIVGTGSDPKTADVIHSVLCKSTKLEWKIGQETQYGKIEKFVIIDNKMFIETRHTARNLMMVSIADLRLPDKKEQPKNYKQVAEELNRRWTEMQREDKKQRICAFAELMDTYNGVKLTNNEQTDFNLKIPYKTSDLQRTRDIIDKYNELIDINGKINDTISLENKIQKQTIEKLNNKLDAIHLITQGLQ